jgi:prephenate dehydrogenase
MNHLPFRNITIVGVGLIGGSLAAAMRRKELPVEITGVSSKRTIAKAISGGLIDRGFPHEELAAGVAEADLVFLCSPIDAIVNLLPKVAAAVPESALVTDVGSTKEHIVEIAAGHFGRGPYFVGGHPMAGSEKQGVEAADPFLFENATWVLTPTGEVPQQKLMGLNNLLQVLGAQVLLLDPQLHDQIAATVSHLPQLIAVALMNYAGRRNETNPFYLRLAAGGFRDMTRIASSPYDMWRDILQTNKENISRSIAEFLEVLESLRQQMAAGEIRELFDQAARTRLSIPKDTRGFLRPHFDISVVVEDRPGIIAAISTALAEAEINIKDIEVLKVREGEGGTLRLAFESDSDRERAIAILAGKGFKAQPR